MFGAPQRAAFAPVRDDGTFEVIGIIPGQYRLTATSRTATQLTGIWVRSAVSAGRDLLDTPITFTPGQTPSDIVVTLTDRHSAIFGSLSTPAGQPASDYSVLVFPADRGLWAPDSRRTRSARPATDGAFTFDDLPMGAYLLAAVDDLEPADLADAAFLAAVASAGVPVTLGQGERKRQDLRLAGR
jgi:hypothetical protein